MLSVKSAFMKPGALSFPRAELTRSGGGETPVLQWVELVYVQRNLRPEIEAFTGAADRQDGAFQRADGGTLFLDEVGDMAPDAQAKLLRTLQDHVVTRLGGSKELPVDVRVLAVHVACFVRVVCQVIQFVLTVMIIDEFPFFRARHNTP